MMRAFNRLSAARSMGYGMANPISTADALAYITAAPFCDPLYFLDVMRALDALWMTDAAEKAERAAKK